ncbi:hypothetical protein [Haloferax volcanii]|uniref:Uncharacterized protein n=1 Tax=Haloferax volcanii JCM 10717 TaxID=1227458 RepID=M0I9T7_HALVO|nr:hypothetical protein [Haloferax alexandrinus]ELZ93565.1 hypothetical protein C452_05073 [Haloferax alexandrinus JCM 10717]
MAERASHDEHSDDDYLAFEIEKTSDGLRIETSRDETYTFVRDDEGVLTSDRDDVPSAILAALRFEDYEIAE